MLLGNRPQNWLVTGGTITTVTINGVTWQVHTFNAGGTLLIGGPLGVLTPDDAFDPRLFGRYLLVGGGGGGGSGSSAGSGGSGAGGGVRQGADRIRAGSYAVTVGAGGAGGSVLNSAGSGSGLIGGSSSAFGLSAAGGGGGGFSSNGVTGGNGGAGGNGGGGGEGLPGSSPGAGNTPATTPAQGVAGSGIVGGGRYACTDISGSWAFYSVPGATTSAAVVNGAANTGNGGSGGDGSRLGGAGGSGQVVFAWPTS